MARGTRRGVTAALVAAAGLLLAGCGDRKVKVPTEPNGMPVPTAGEARQQLEYFIATDLRDRAHDAGLKGTLRVRSVHCAKRDRIHYVCRIRTSSSYSSAAVDVNVADAFYNPRTDQAGYDIRP